MALLNRSSPHDRILVSFCEISDEDLVRDLIIPSSLASGPRRLRIREHVDQRGAFVKDLSEVVVKSKKSLEVFT